MKRRSFIALTAAAMAIAPAAMAGGAKTVDYRPGVIKNALADGKTVFVDYAADWCSTCARQERVIEALRKSNPAYNSMVFVRVDWDKYGRKSVTRDRGVPRRSTLILLKGDDELGRIVAGTGEREIKALLDKGLAAGA